MIVKTYIKLGFFGCALLLSSCTEKSTETVKIGVTHCCVTSDSFMWSVAQGIQKAAANYPLTLNFHNAEGSQNKQLNQIKKMINEGDKVILSSIVIDNTVQKTFQRQILDLMKDQSIPIIFYTIEPKIGFLEQYPNAYFVGSIPEQSGIIQGEMIVEQWRKNPNWDKNQDGVIQYVILKGPDGNPDAEGRTKWVQATIKNYPDAGVQAKLLDLKSGQWQRKKASDIVQMWDQSGLLDQAEIIISNNDDMALGALDYLERENKSLPIFGVDALPDALKAIKENKMSGTVKQDAAGQARAAAKLADNLAHNKPLDKDLEFQIIQKKVIVPYIQIDNNNINTFL